MSSQQWSQGPGTQPGEPQRPGGRRSGGWAWLLVAGAVVFVAILVVVAVQMVGGKSEPGPGVSSAPVASPSASVVSPPTGSSQLVERMPTTVGGWSFTAINETDGFYMRDGSSDIVATTALPEGAEMESRVDIMDDPVVSEDGRLVCGLTEGVSFCYLETADGRVMAIGAGVPDEPPLAEVRSIAEAVFAAVG